MKNDSAAIIAIGGVYSLEGMRGVQSEDVNNHNRKFDRDQEGRGRVFGVTPDFRPIEASGG
ncbi:hypothetical protein HB771_12140 [Rhizobium leguminosarum bv. viciae]|nr:hypothetical protein HB771_12140 [Rhizobium leguminosarum bv. viciae]